MRLIIEQNYQQLSAWAASYIVKRINEFGPTAEKPFVLGLPTGGTPMGTYKELIRLHKEGKVSFQNVVTFNMDEYCGLPQEHPESYHSFMWNNFFSHVDVKKENVNILNGNAEDLNAECARYEEKIKSYGGIHLFMGGIGPDGHIAFNEPDSSFYYETHLTDLTDSTIEANSRFFDSIDDVPKQAITMGLGTIMKAKKIVLLASGKNKHKAIASLLGDKITSAVPATLLKVHPDVVIICDEAAYNG